MSLQPSLRLLIVLLSSAATSSPALAALAESADCYGYDALSGNPDIAIGRIGGTSRTYFIRNESEAPACPDASNACRAKAFVVPGDRVILSEKRGAFVCVDYIGAKGADRAGWLPGGAVAREDPVPVALSDWTGTWLREEATITLKRAKTGALAIHGDATFGAQDPDRVKRGAVNLGAIEGVIAPSGADLSFAIGDKATLPVGKAQDGDCQVWMRRLGPFLLVDDNNACGGMNVTFRGVYGRKP